MSIAVNDLRAGIVFKDEQGVWQVESFNHVKMGRGSAVIKVKARNLVSGAITEKSFISGNKVDEAEADKRKVQYLYTNANALYFMDPQSFDQFSLPLSRAEDVPNFIKEGESVDLLIVEGSPTSIEMPKNVPLKVIEADPGERGNSVSNLSKSCTVETGLKVSVPLFIKVGDTIKVDTRTRNYVERLA